MKLKLVTKIYLKGALLILTIAFFLWNLNLPDWAIPVLLVGPVMGFCLANRKDLIEEFKKDEALK